MHKFCPVLERTIDLLEAQRFRVLRHQQVPPNDGGISLGQAMVVSRNGFGSLWGKRGVRAPGPQSQRV